MTIWLEIDPNVVKPGWMPMVILLLLGAAMVFLYRSMRRQFGKINLPSDRSPGAGPSRDADVAGPDARPDNPSTHTGSPG
jgi:hypothetical protein